MGGARGPEPQSRSRRQPREGALRTTPNHTAVFAHARRQHLRAVVGEAPSQKTRTTTSKKRESYTPTSPQSKQTHHLHSVRVPVAPLVRACDNHSLLRAGGPAKSLLPTNSMLPHCSRHPVISVFATAGLLAVRARRPSGCTAPSLADGEPERAASNGDPIHRHRQLPAAFVSHSEVSLPQPWFPLPQRQRSAHATTRPAIPCLHDASTSAVAPLVAHADPERIVGGPTLKWPLSLEQGVLKVAGPLPSQSGGHPQPKGCFAIHS